ncbi:MAG: aminoglycoside phosphotransferase family protein, partial [Nocardiopsaceae bacterium]|nr:aminoglycoside phosphotransferase family protein [Nocardiopsaceae bacterium]
MAEGGDAPRPAAVLAAFGLHGPVTEWSAVGGAWSNRVYRLVAGGRSFAVKEMRNPWRDPRWQEWLTASWSFEQLAIAAGVRAPRPVPNPADGGCLAWVRRSDPALPHAPVRLHHWVTGHPVGAGTAPPETARWAGHMLAVLHGLRVRAQDRTVYPFPNTDVADRWSDLTRAAERRNAHWASLLTAAAPAVSQIADLARSAGFLPDHEVISHGDIDQKNLIASADGPVLCDWDLAVPVVPRRELADVALSLGLWRDFGIARAVVDGYRAAGGADIAFEPHDLGPSLISGLDWI